MENFQMSDHPVYVIVHNEALIYHTPFFDH